jgi:hypothetical protein
VFFFTQARISLHKLEKNNNKRKISRSIYLGDAEWRDFMHFHHKKMTLGENFWLFVQILLMFENEMVLGDIWWLE